MDDFEGAFELGLDLSGLFVFGVDDENVKDAEGAVHGQALEDEERGDVLRGELVDHQGGHSQSVEEQQELDGFAHRLLRVIPSVGSLQSSNNGESSLCNNEDVLDSA